ncbi:MAG: HIT domain-containing protein [Chloroflexi bacterium]|nr:HIT domain-containing protein [Chloroflexota bacterium]
MPRLVEPSEDGRRGPRKVVNRPVNRYCVFCEIAAHREPADILYEDEDVMVFRNRLRWVPVMLLAIPKRHMTQAELWKDMGAVGAVATSVAQAQCPGGYRLISNIGYDGMQSQDHAHVHILGGMFLGEYA